MARKTVIVTSIFILSLLAALSASTGSAKEQKGTEPYVANFNYTPDSHAAPGSAGVTFALGSVSFITDWPEVPWFREPMFANLDGAVKDDLAEILRAKGFTLRELASPREMTYSDKKAIELLLETTIGLKTKTTTLSTGKKGYANMGTITLEIREPVSRELLWSNKVTFEAPWGPDHGGYWWLPVAREMEKQYPDLMARIARLIDPEEMRILKKQAQEMKRKKGY